LVLDLVSFSIQYHSFDITFGETPVIVRDSDLKSGEKREEKMRMRRRYEEEERSETTKERRETKIRHLPAKRKETRLCRSSSPLVRSSDVKNGDGIKIEGDINFRDSTREKLNIPNKWLSLIQGRSPSKT